jgi:hypothetical protein
MRDEPAVDQDVQEEAPRLVGRRDLRRPEVEQDLRVGAGDQVRGLSG